VSSVLEIVELMRRLGVTMSLEEYLGPLFKEVKFSGYGVIAKAPRRVLVRVLRRLKSEKEARGRTGKLVVFKSKSASELAEFADYVYFLADTVEIGGVGLSVSGLPVSKVGVYALEVKRPWSGVRFRFKPWQVYSGRVCVGRRCREFNWFIVVPTYSKRYYMVLTHPEDLERPLPDRSITFPIINLVESYLRRGTAVMTIKNFAAPIFSYKSLS